MDLPINLSLWLAFLAASAALIATPGPIVTLVVAQAAIHGRRVGFATVLGTTIASAVQLALVILGLAALVAAFSGLFEIVRWLGAAYLIFLGVQAWRRAGRPSEEEAIPLAARAGAGFRRGLLVALSNPKTLLFHSAFLPLFVDPSSPAAPQFAVLGVSFIVVAFCLDMVWMLTAAGLAARLSNGRARAFIERISGGVLIAGGLALASRRA
ncbi:MAG: LysE family translocator [Maricaulaceae bacterium]|jgi:threonine/homoserine/homoserine lactone efflux protein